MKRSTPLSFGVWLVAATSPLFFTFSANAEIVYYECRYKETWETYPAILGRDTVVSKILYPSFYVDKTIGIFECKNPSVIYSEDGTDSIIVKMECDTPSIDKLNADSKTNRVAKTEIRNKAEKIKNKKSVAGWIK